MSNKESEVKKYWDERPCNVRHSSSEFGSRQYFDEVEAKRYLVEPHNPVFACFDKWKDKDVLEIGCGIGTDTINFARAGARVVAIDVSRKSIEVAKKRAEDAQRQRDEIRAATREINNIKCEMHEIKGLLQELVSKE